MGDFCAECVPPCEESFTECDASCAKVHKLYGEMCSHVGEVSVQCGVGEGKCTTSPTTAPTAPPTTQPTPTPTTPPPTTPTMPTPTMPTATMPTPLPTPMPTTMPPSVAPVPCVGS